MSNFASSAGANAFLNSPHVEKNIGPNPATERGKGLHINVHPTLPLLIYPSGKFVVVKNYLNPSECFVYRGHAANPTVAKFSPNGFWVASGDAAGKVRIWSWDNPEHLTKLESPVFNGCVYDLDWDNESKKLIAVGDGSGLLVKCFTWDTGNSAGEMTGHSKRVLSCSYKPSRPFRVLTGGEDMRTIFYAGPPFKLDHSNAPHTNFVNCVRYSLNGNKIASVGSDKKIQFYDGATGNPTGEVLNAHEGGIYSCSFSADGAYLVTASADKTLKVWNSETCALEQTFTPGNGDAQLGDMQVSCLWHKDSILSVSLNGNLNVWSRANTAAPERVIFAHQVAITAMYYDVASGSLFSGSYDGVIVSRNLSSFDAQKFSGGDKKSVSNAIHSGKVVGVVVRGDLLTSIGWDDKIRFASLSSRAYHSEKALNGQPIAIASSPSSEFAIVVTNAEISAWQGTNQLWAQPIASLGGYTPTCLALYNDNEVAIGGSDNKTHVYSITGNKLSEITAIETRSAVSALSYSSNGQYLAIGDVGRQVEVYEHGSWAIKVKGKWVNHTSRITALHWSPNGDRLASGSLDENIYVWNLSKPGSFLQLPFSHSGGVSGLQWMDDNKLVSVGNDHTTVTWKIPPSA